MNKAEWIEAYNNGLSAYAIARLSHVTPPVIYKHLHKMGVSCRSNSSSHIKTGSLDKILKQFNEGISVTKLASEHGYSITGMSELLKRNGISTITAPQNKGDWSFINVKQQLFFYWLGWMLADGCIYHKRRDNRNRGVSAILTVHRNDNHILEFFRDIIYPQQKIHVVKKNNCNRLDLSIPRHVAMELETWGLIPNKTYEFKITSNLQHLSDDQFCQFLIGFIEGDGSIGILNLKSRKTIRKVPRVRICSGSQVLIEWLRERITQFNIPPRKIYTKPRSKYYAAYEIAGSDAIKLYKILITYKYKLLNRKWDRLEEFLK